MNGTYLFILLVLFAQISAERYWDFTNASSVIGFIEQRLASDKASRRNLLPLLNDIKRHLADLKRTSNNETISNLRPVLRKTVMASNRDSIRKKGTARVHESKGLLTYKGHEFRLLDLIPSKVQDADRICRPGPFHDHVSSRTSNKHSEKKCLILGDSISIGYSSYVAEMLEGDCTVHHSPWSGDGGALDTNHVLKCLPLLLSSSVYEPVQYDAIIFNSGLHDYVPLSTYVANLRKIKKILLETGAVIAFATSTPVPFDKKINRKLQKYNKAAKKIMADVECIPVIDLYKTIIKDCEGVPLRHCHQFQDQPNVLVIYRTNYKMPKILGCKDSRPVIASRDSKYCLGQIGEHNEEPSQQRLTGCPANATCCLSEYSHSFVGCCMLKDAMDCGDSWHCCPMGTVCDPTCSIKGCSCRNAPWESIASRTVFSALMKSLNIFWNKITKKYEH
ncbi:hypothetical protein P5673_017725 [Acropora cervicornis]|uniref:Granulins domain-containing protein n=1 Tax=Acropora cervicornis TaxID=6130 RepID=A0AAD9QE73_ACRCE|nr:hypothetical protein P5673_017725 [Acropora cervicornis]